MFQPYTKILVEIFHLFRLRIFGNLLRLSQRNFSFKKYRVVSVSMHLTFYTGCCKGHLTLDV
jgi:hypothetical protein